MTCNSCNIEISENILNLCDDCAPAVERDTRIYALLSAVDPIREYLRDRGETSLDAILAEYLLDQMRGADGLVCSACQDTGYVETRGLGSLDNPEGEYSHRCECQAIRERVTGDPFAGIDSTSIPF